MKTEFEKKLKFAQRPPSLSERLKKEKLPLILWGIGDVGAEVKHYLDGNGISIAAAWVDNIDQEKYFEGVPVYSLDTLKSMYKRFNVILGHSHYDYGRTIEEKEECIDKVFYLIDSAYSRYESADPQFIHDHLEEYYDTYMLLDDDVSRESMVAYLNCKMNDEIGFILDYVKKEQNFFNNDIFKVGSQEAYVDVGAYDGDTLDLFLEECGGSYKKIYALEPENDNFSKLEEYVTEHKLQNVVLKKQGTWKEKTTLFFDAKQQQRSAIDVERKEGTTINVDALDNILQGEDVTLIKINFPDGAYETLQGSRDIFERCAPKLAIIVGNDEKAMIRLPQLVKKQRQDYHIYFRFSTCMPYRLYMYAIKEDTC